MMIISASRRTDIPSFYFDWFTNRLKERFVLVRNPVYPNQISRIDLSPELIDCIVFWTKNPSPAMDKLDSLKDYPFYFQFTLTSYSIDAEMNMPSKSKEIINTFKKLSEKIGPERVIWRYDPIFLSRKYNMEYHIKYFEKIAGELSDYTKRCVFSFIDFYPKIKKQLNEMGAFAPDKEEKIMLARELQNISYHYGFSLETCSETLDLSGLGIKHGKCIDDKLIEKLTGFSMNLKKDSNQRRECGCMESVDIGSYDTCGNGCKYCYANHSIKRLEQNRRMYDVNSPVLCSRITEEDQIKVRAVQAQRQEQLLLKL
ncbi:DUF1848 domain-containing protein [Aminipila sp.]|uniref:DUF1848 domain-containing protein n=1 Tax=Aminipila sp. TaxID=2060095 RepID=UPI00289E28E2|nr:DUF1848 domain-containing protein [Aminipila sp.]